MIEVSWSRRDGRDCVRLAGLAPDARVEVRAHLTAGADVGAGRLPATAGSLVGSEAGGDVWFVPRFAFVDGTAYTVEVDGVEAAVLRRPRPDRPSTTEVLAVYPSVPVVPRNLLRLYVHFSAPMSEGEVSRHVRLADDAGETVPGALLPGRDELWDPARRRLTVLLDPARIKRGLLPHRQAGYPLRVGTSFQVVVGQGFRDATGTPLRAKARRHYQVGADQRGHVDPGRWTLVTPPAGSAEPLEVTFDRSLDHGLLGRCLRVTGPDGRGVAGAASVGAEQQSWCLIPGEPWAATRYRLVVDPVLEDLAGNSLARVFDRDLDDPADRPRPDRPAAVAFHPR